MSFENSREELAPSLSINENDPLLPRPETNHEIKSKNAASPWHVIISLFFITFGMGALLAPMVQFYTEIFCARYYETSNNTTDGVITWIMGAKAIPDSPSHDCTIPEIQAIVSRVQTILLFLDSAICLCMASFYGSLSDRYGRRIVFRIFAIGGIAIMLCYIAIANFPNIVGISLIIAVPFLRGFLVSDVIVAAASQSYVVDCTTPEERTVFMGRMIASMLAAVVCGPTMASMIVLKTGSVVYVFYFVLTVYIVFYLYSTYIMPESLSQEAMETAQHKVTQEIKQNFWQRINIFSSLSILVKAAPTNVSSYALPILSAVAFLLASLAQPPILLYAMLQFKWTAYEGGLFASSMGLTRFIIIVWILPFILRTVQAKWQQHGVESSDKDYHRVQFDLRMIRFGFGFETVAILLATFTTSGTWFTFCMILQSWSIIGQPSLLSLTTTLVDPSEVGALCAAQTVLAGVATLTTVTGINFIFSMSVKTMPTLFLYVCAGITGLACLLSFLVHPIKPQNEYSTP